MRRFTSTPPSVAHMSSSCSCWPQEAPRWRPCGRRCARAGFVPWRRWPRCDMRIILLALRNLGRNRRRTLIALGTVAFGSLAIVFLQGFVNGFIRMGIEASVLSKVGAIQIHRKGYFEADEPLKLNLGEDPQTIAAISAVPGVSAVAPRISFDGLLSNGSESAIFMATAIDPVREYAVCPLRRTNIERGS